PSAPCNTGELAVKAQHLTRRQPTLVAKQLGQIAHAPTRLAISRRCAEQPGLTRGGRGESEQKLDCCGLAGSVGAEKAENFAPRNRHRQPRQGDGAAEALAQLLGVDGSGCGSRRGLCLTQLQIDEGISRESLQSSVPGSR